MFCDALDSRGTDLVDVERVVDYIPTMRAASKPSADLVRPAGAGVLRSVFLPLNVLLIIVRLVLVLVIANAHGVHA